MSRAKLSPWPLEGMETDTFHHRTEAFIKLRQELTRLELEFEQARKLINSLETQLADKNREVLALQADLSAVQKDSIAALDELKNTDKLISTSLTSELERQREEYSFIMNERDALKSQLIEALLANDKLRKESDESKDLQEGTGLSTDGDGSEAAKKATEKVEKLRARLIQRNQVGDELCWVMHVSCTSHSRLPSATRKVGTRKARTPSEAEGSTAWGRLSSAKGMLITCQSMDP